MKKTIRLFFVNYLLFILISSCTTKNLFYGIDAEDKEGPSISLKYPINSGGISVGVLSGTFNLIGTSNDRGGNDVLKIEIRTYNTGTSSWNPWQLANGTTNWSYTLDSLSDWGVVSGNRNIEIRASDTNYKTNFNTVAYTLQIDNTNPALIGSISDGNDTVNYDGNATLDGYHNAIEGNIMAYNWDWEPGVKGYELIVYDSTTGLSDKIVKNVPIPGNFATINVPADINAGVGFTTGISLLPAGPPYTYEQTAGNRVYFRFQGEDGHKYYLAVKPYDFNDQRAAAKLGVEETIDTVAPPVVTTFLVNGLGDSSTHDSLQVTFSWAAVADAQTSIRYYLLDVDNDAAAGACVGDVGVDVVVAGASNNYSYTYVLDGTYTARIKAVDMAGNCSASWYAINTFVVNDNVPVDISGLAILSDTGISNAAYECGVNDGYQCGGEGLTVAYRWTDIAAHASYRLKLTRLNDGAIDEFSFVKPSAVWANVGGGSGVNTSTSIVQARLNGGNIEFHFDGDNGMKYQIQIKGYSTTGVPSNNWVSSTDIFLDTTPPNVITTVTDPGAYYKVSANVPFSWTAATDPDPGAIELPSGIDYYQGSSSNDGGTYSAATNIGSVTNIVTNGYGTETYSNTNPAYYRVRAVDKAGNIQATYQSSDGVIIQTAIGNIGAITHNGGVDNDRDNADGTRTVSFNWADPTGIPTGYTVILHETKLEESVTYNVTEAGVVSVTSGSISNLLALPTFVGATNTFSFMPNGAVADGRKYFIQVKGYDAASNESSDWASSVTILVDIVNPTAGTVSDDGAYSLSQTVKFSWAGFSDAGSGLSSYNIYGKIGAGAWSGATNVGLSTNYTYNFGAPAEGQTVYLRVCSVDVAGNTNDPGTSCADSDGIYVDTTNPDFTFSVPAADRAESNTANFIYTMTSTHGDVSGFEYIVMENGIIETTGTVAGSSPQSISLSLIGGVTFLDGAAYTVLARTVDNAGRTSSWFVSNIIKYDVTAPVAPLNLGLVDGAVGGDAVITWNASFENGSGVDYYELLITRVGTGATATIRIFTTGVNSDLESIIGVGQVEITDAVVAPNDVLDDTTPIPSFDDVANGDSNPEFQITIRVKGFPENYNVQVKAVDNAGNDSGYSAATANVIIN